MSYEEYVKKALEEAIPFIASKGYDYVGHIMHDALELLKEQEPKTVLHRDDGDYCPWCSTIATRTMGVQKLHPGTSFCPYCGKGVAWDDS